MQLGDVGLGFKVWGSKKLNPSLHDVSQDPADIQSSAWLAWKWHATLCYAHTHHSTEAYGAPETKH